MPSDFLEKYDTSLQKDSSANHLSQTSTFARRYFPLRHEIVYICKNKYNL